MLLGNYEGPHDYDVELKDIVDIVLRAEPAGIVLESCNPEAKARGGWSGNRFAAEGKYLVPGVIDSTTTMSTS